MNMWQFEDIPQIDGKHLDYHALPYTQQYGYFNTDDGSFFDANDNTMVDPTMQRYLSDVGPICPNLLHPRTSIHGQFGGYCEQPWSSSGIVRNISPDRTSASDKSSCGTQNELRSPHMYTLHQYGSPMEYSPASLPYLQPELFCGSSYLPEIVVPSASVNPREVEYEPHAPEPEPIVEDDKDIQVEEDITCNHSQSTAKPNGTPTYSSYANSGIEYSVRDAESVQLEPYEEPASDSDYNPTGRASKRKRSSASNSSSSRTQKRRSNGRKDSVTSDSSGTIKRSRRTSNASKSATESNTSKDRRPFPCPLAGYGCTSKFSSKNEWKRHVATQHIKLIKWRCDLCAPTTDPKDDPKGEKPCYFNEFNRKDLFTQHLRRMHAAPKEKVGRIHKEYPVNEDNLAEHQERCVLPLRTAPQQSSCLFCPRTFNGGASWEERMEHIGRHLEKDNKINVDMLDVASWNVDAVLETYLLEEGLIDRVSGEWQIGDGTPRRLASVGSDDESEEE